MTGLRPQRWAAENRVDGENGEDRVDGENGEDGVDGVDRVDGVDGADRVDQLCPLLTPQLLAPIRSTLQTWGKPASGASGLSECGQHASAGALGVCMDHPLWDMGVSGPLF